MQLSILVGFFLLLRVLLIPTAPAMFTRLLIMLCDCPMFRCQLKHGNASVAGPGAAAPANAGPVHLLGRAVFAAEESRTMLRSDSWKPRRICIC